MFASSVFGLAPRPDLEALRARYAATGRVHVPDFLRAGDAAALRTHLLQRPDWKLVLNRGEQIYEYGAEERSKIGPDQLAVLQVAVENAGRTAFQFYYENVRVPERLPEADPGTDLLLQAACLLNSPAFLDLARSLTGAADIAFADCQATRYGRGHFLNTHDDDVGKKGRLAAYVLNLTPDWRVEWGGQLQFLGEDGHVAEAFVPRFNALNILRVPQPHLVSMVSGLAPPQAQRLSITGWLRVAPSS